MVIELINKLKEKGYTQTAIQRETGIPHSSISRYLSGSTKPGAKELAKLVLLAESNNIKIANHKYRAYIISALVN